MGRISTDNNGTSKYNQPALTDIPSYCLPPDVPEAIVHEFPAVRYLFRLSDISSSTTVAFSSSSSIPSSASAESVTTVSLTLPPVQTIQDQLDYITRFRSSIQSARIPTELYPSLIEYLSTLLLSTYLGNIIGKDLVQLLMNIRQQLIVNDKGKNTRGNSGNSKGNNSGKITKDTVVDNQDDASSLSTSSTTTTRDPNTLFNTVFITWYTRWLDIHQPLFTNTTTNNSISNTSILIQGKDIIHRLTLLIDDRIIRETFMEIQSTTNILQTLNYLVTFTQNLIDHVTTANTTSNGDSIVTPPSTITSSSSSSAVTTGISNTTIDISYWILFSGRTLNTLLLTAKKFTLLSCKENLYNGEFLLDTIIQMCKHILSSQWGTRDCIMTIAMLLGHALSYIHRKDFGPYDTVNNSTSKDGTTTLDDIAYTQTYIQNVLSIIGDTYPSTTSSSSSSWFLSLLPFQQLALLRGILVNCPMTILLLSSSSSSVSMLTNIFYEFIDNCCKATDIIIRLSGIQGLDTILSISIKAEQYRKKFSNEFVSLQNRSGDRLRFLSQDTPVLSESIIERILQHLLLNWSHPNKGVANRVTDVFEELLSYFDTLSSTRSVSSSGPPSSLSPSVPSPTPLSSSFAPDTMLQYHRLLPLILNQPITLLSRYGALSRLLNRMGALAILDRCPTLIQELYYAMTITADLTNTCNSFLTSFLISLRYGYEELYDLKIKGKENSNNTAWKRGVIAKRLQTNSGYDSSINSTANGTPDENNVSRSKGNQQPVTEKITNSTDPSLQSKTETIEFQQLYMIIKNAGLEAYLPPFVNFSPFYPYTAVPSSSSSSSSSSSASDQRRYHRDSSLASEAGIISRTVIEQRVNECIAKQSLPPEYKDMVIIELCYSNSYKLWCCQWIPILITYLLHPCRDIRYKIVTHALKDITPMDEITAYLCCQEIQRYTPVQKPLTVPALPELLHSSSSSAEPSHSDTDFLYQYKGDDELSLVERKLYGKLYLIYHIRSNNLPYSLPWDVTELRKDPSSLPLQYPAFAPLLREDDIQTAMKMPDLDTRILILDILCITSAVPNVDELRYIYEWLRLNHKITFNETKKRVLRSLTACIQRIVAGFVPSKTRDQKAALNKQSSLYTLAYYQPCIDFVRNVATLCIDCCYPGAVVDRMGLALEILDALTVRIPLIKDSFNISTDLTNVTSTSNNVYLLSATLSRILTTPASVTVLLNGCSHSVERFRQCFSNILIRFPSNEINGYTSVSSIRGLLQFALILTQSPRDREAAAGAIYLRTFYRTWVLQHGYCVSFTAFPDSLSEYRNGHEIDITITEGSHQPPTPEDVLEASIIFIQNLIALFDARMYTFRIALETLLGVTFPGSPTDYLLPTTEAKHGYRSLLTDESIVTRKLFSPLGHGLVYALRLILIEVQTLQFTASTFSSVVNRNKPSTTLKTEENSYARTVQASYRSIVRLLFRAVRTTQLSALRVVAGSYEHDQDAGGPDAKPKALHTETSDHSDSNKNNSTDEYVLTFEGRVDCRPTVSTTTTDNTLGKPSYGTTPTTDGIRTPVSNSVSHLSSTTSIAMIDIHATGRNLQDSDDKRKRVAELFGKVPSDIRSKDGWHEAQTLMNQGNTAKENGEVVDEETERIDMMGDGDNEETNDVAMNATDDSVGNGEIDMAHMMIVASWLLTRECAMLQGELIQRFPVPSLPASYVCESRDTLALPVDTLLFRSENTEHSIRDNANDSWIISTYDIIQSGDVLLQALLTLKHIGSIYNTSEAFQMMITKLLSLSSYGTGSSASESTAPTGVTFRPLPPVSSLPSFWLDRLLQRLQSSTAAQFILRRSAGFSFAFLSLLRAEPKGAPLLMLRKTLVTLLRVAGAEETFLAQDFERYLKNNASNDSHGASDDTTNESTADSVTVFNLFTALYPLPSSSVYNWRSAVHALNILRLLFRDGTLGADIQIFVSTALRTALQGFRSRAWAIRNSSMMVYATIIDRVIGSNASDKYSAKSSTSGSTTGLFSSIGGSTNGLIGTNHKLGIRVSYDRERPNILQFFSRYPGLFEFIVRELQSNLDETFTNLTSSASLSRTTSIASSATLLTPPPSLYPLLLLLSRMKPMLGETNLILQSGTLKLDTDCLLPILLQCAMQRQLAIRRMAARALLSVLVPSSVTKPNVIAPSTLLLSYVRTVLEALGFSPDIPTATPVQSPSTIVFSYGEDIRISLVNTQNTCHGLLLQFDAILNAFMEEYEIIRSSSSFPSSVPTSLSNLSSLIFEVYRMFTTALQYWVPGITVDNKLVGLVQAALLNCVRSLESAALYILNQESGTISREGSNDVFGLANRLVTNEIPSSTTVTTIPLPFLLVLARRALGLRNYNPSVSSPAALSLSSTMDATPLSNVNGMNGIPVNFYFGQDLFYEACGEAMVTSLMIGLYGLSFTSDTKMEDMREQIGIYCSTLRYVLAHPHASVRLSSSKALKRCLKHAHRYVPLKVQLKVSSSAPYITKSISQLELQTRTGSANLSAIALTTYFSTLAGTGAAVEESLFNVFIQTLSTETERSVRQRLLRGLALLLSCINTEQLARYLTKQDTWLTILQAHDTAKDVSSRASVITIIGYFLKPFIHHFLAPASSRLDISRYLPYYKDSGMVDLATVLPLCIQYLYTNSMNYANYTIRYTSIEAIRSSSVLMITLSSCIINYIQYFTTGKDKDNSDGVLYVYLLQHILMKALPLWSTVWTLIDDYEDEIRESTRCTIHDVVVLGRLNDDGRKNLTLSPLSFSIHVLLRSLSPHLQRILPLASSFIMLSPVSSVNESMIQIVSFGIIGTTIKELYQYYRDGTGKDDTMSNTNIYRNLYQQIYEYMNLLSKDTVRYLEQGIQYLPNVVNDIQQTTDTIVLQGTVKNNDDDRPNQVLSSRYPFSTFMLHRILFLPDIDNDYEEKLVTYSLALTLWKYFTVGRNDETKKPDRSDDDHETTHNPFGNRVPIMKHSTVTTNDNNNGMIITNQSTIGQILSSSLQFIELMNNHNSNYDLLDPILGRVVSWISGGSMDDNPELYSYARIAETLIN